MARSRGSSAVGSRSAARSSGEPEVRDAHAPVVAAQHVRRLHVAVHEALRVRGREPARRVEEGREHVAMARPRRAPAPRVERLPLDELHRHEHVAVVLPHVVDLHDVRVRQLAERARLAHEQRPRALGAARRVHQLERHAPVELGVVRRVDHAHPAAAEQRQDEVAPDRRAAREHAGAAARRQLGRAVVGRRRRADEAAAVGAGVEVGLDLVARRAREAPFEQLEQPIVVDARALARGALVAWASRGHEPVLSSEESVTSSRLRTSAKSPSHSDGERRSRSISRARVRASTSSCAASIQRMAVVLCTPYMTPTRAGVRCSTKVSRRSVRSRRGSPAIAARKASTKSPAWRAHELEVEILLGHEGARDRLRVVDARRAGLLLVEQVQRGAHGGDARPAAERALPRVREDLWRPAGRAHEELLEQHLPRLGHQICARADLTQRRLEVLEEGRVEGAHGLGHPDGAGAREEHVRSRQALEPCDRRRVGRSALAEVRGERGRLERHAGPRGATARVERGEGRLERRVSGGVRPRAPVRAVEALDEAGRALHAVRR
jgi:hypothetical protein